MSQCGIARRGRIATVCRNASMCAATWKMVSVCSSSARYSERRATASSSNAQYGPRPWARVDLDEAGGEAARVGARQRGEAQVGGEHVAAARAQRQRQRKPGVDVEAATSAGDQHAARIRKAREDRWFPHGVGSYWYQYNTVIVRQWNSASEDWLTIA